MQGSFGTGTTPAARPRPQAHPGCADRLATPEPLQLTVLGSASPYPRADNPCSGYLVSHRGTRIWVDAGSGTLGPLQEHVPLADLDAVWISHLHADHCADLLTAYYGLLFADVQRAAPLPLFAPAGTADRLAGFLTNTAHPSQRSPVESAFRITELHDGHQTVVGSLRLTSRAVEHGMPAFALRVDADGGSLVYSGDTAPCPALTQLAGGCDALLCEADSAGEPVDGEKVHHTPEDAAATALASRAGRLLLTHVGPFLSPAEAVQRAADRYSGAVDYAGPGSSFTVGAADREAAS
ncbi:MBL fold metallo-hydrolase [Arthrobacter sp. Sa2CUA1]|uniref:MBL fold metallo-hydrolase n=2 Tax=Arthrobacter gallicola TaxID=2762225 RepID=A0ABR8UR93_9MICC|nr:MBL fold metallo-hydrolase [Arthrobacter gallicola]